MTDTIKELTDEIKDFQELVSALDALSTALEAASILPGGLISSGVEVIQMLIKRQLESINLLNQAIGEVEQLQQVVSLDG